MHESHTDTDTTEYAADYDVHKLLVGDNRFGKHRGKNSDKRRNHRRTKYRAHNKRSAYSLIGYCQKYEIATVHCHGDRHSEAKQFQCRIIHDLSDSGHTTHNHPFRIDEG